MADVKEETTVPKDDEYQRAQKSKFRFKSKKRSHDESSGGDSEEGKSSHRHKRSHRHHHSSRSHRRRHKSPVDDPSSYDDTHLPNSSSKAYIDPEIAFRESLFDAMADDEGAAFWEGVYGQPVHTYPDVKEGPDGKLEKMTDDEYAKYVRKKMYEKTHQHLLEERERRKKAKEEHARLAEEGHREEREAQKFQQKVEESLRKGQERKSRKAWGERWDAYIKRWDELAKSTGKNPEHIAIPWPVESGKSKDINKEEIQRFFLYAPTSGQPTETQLSKILKAERVRWHPDKIQHKLGGQGVLESTMQTVTAVFQIIDKIWNEVRNTGK